MAINTINHRFLTNQKLKCVTHLFQSMSNQPKINAGFNIVCQHLRYFLMFYYYKSLFFFFFSSGHYCPLETQSPTQFPCVAGSWTNLTNLKSQEECYECPKGWFCLTASTAPTDLCFTGHYCPPGVCLYASPFFFFRIERNVLFSCNDDGFQCVCAIGTKRGNEFPCPAGTYNNRTGLERVHDCVPCITGHYCPQGTTNPLKCPRGTFNDVLGAKVSSLLCFCGLSQKPCSFQKSPPPQIILRCNILCCSKANAMKQKLKHSYFCPF